MSAKTTIELPDETMLRIKIHAARTNQKLRYLFEYWIEQGLKADEKTGARVPIPAAIKKSKLPKVAPGPRRALTARSARPRSRAG